MMRDSGFVASLGALLAAAAICSPSWAQTVVLDDPRGDDKGPGTYVYPTDPIYRPGSFDITRLEMTLAGDYVDFAVTVAADLENPWRMSPGFSLQFPIVFIAAGELGLQESPPGLNVAFDFLGWDRAILMSPQDPARVRREIGEKAPTLSGELVVPTRIGAQGRTITARVPRSALPDTNPAEWGLQVVMQRNDGFASSDHLLMTAVNEYEGSHRFGGGHDGVCDPNVIDMLAASAEIQYEILGGYQCGSEGEAETLAVLSMVFPGD